MHEIDASFSAKKKALAARRRGARRRKIALAGGLVLALLAAVFYLTADQWSFHLYEDEVIAQSDDAEELPEDAFVYVPAIVDLPGDPMIISLGGDGAASRRRTLPRPADLEDPGISQRIEILSDAMISASQRFMTTIPSSQEDFAFFQAQRRAPAIAPEPEPQAFDDGGEPAEDEAGEAYGDAGWGEAIGGDGTEPQDFARTEIEDTTSLTFVAPEEERFQAVEDIFVRVLGARTLASIVQENRFAAEEARLAGETLQELLGIETLEPGFVVALRGVRQGRNEPPRLVQVSVYSSEVYVGTLARDGEGAFVAGTDPWVREDLFHYTGEADDAGPQRQYRLLDAIYSTAARNQVPTAVIGEAIMYLSRGHDLNAFATHEDSFVIVYSATPRDEESGGGRVLYAAVHGPDRAIECLVFRPAGGEFGCMSQDRQVHSLTVIDGMVTPVNGVMTSTFGPRRHPILKTVRVHAGVDWSAPVGTPVFAAFDGEVDFRGDAGGYGNLVRLSHAGGRQTRYAHLDRFASGLAVGGSVKAGDVIGYVGSTGLSTGPHLHFELHAGGTAINPLATAAAVASDGGAVDALTDRIIQVESAGNPAAKNPLSSATGLGQFISSTWLRMMRTYRPDLARSLSAQELLALRFDPTISREMVRNLAREGESYLRARGHQITAGRLYLCHFLGMEGAHLILSSAPSTALVDVLGQPVITANPFLRGRDAAWVINWAEGKMRPRGRSAPPTQTTITREVAQAGPEFDRYRQAITQLLAPQAEAL